MKICALTMNRVTSLDDVGQVTQPRQGRALLRQFGRFSLLGGVALVIMAMGVLGLLALMGPDVSAATLSSAPIEAPVWASISPSAEVMQALPLP